MKTAGPLADIWSDTRTMPHRHDPTRRNRNIGTPKQGHGRNNRDRVPRLWSDSVVTWDRGHSHTVVTRHVWGRTMPFLIEPTRQDCAHACTVDDIAKVLNLLPKRHINNYSYIDGIQGIVLRQPTRKEQSLSPVWARLGYCVEVGGVLGPVVFIEAQQIPLAVHWGTSINPSDQRELDRLVDAADDVQHSRRGHDLRFDLAGVRRVQLFHSLPHEIGHWADMYEHVERPGLDDLDQWEPLWDRYFQRPGSEREEFAHRYAENAIAELRQAGAVPFDRKLNADALVAEGLRLEDFQPEPEG